MTNAAYQIEKNIPLAASFRRKATYPFGTMKVGDSFALVNSDLKEIERVRAAASYYGIRHAPIKFSCRMTDPVNKQYRCWRIA